MTVFVRSERCTKCDKRATVFLPLVADPDRGVIDEGLRQLVAAKGHLRILQRIQRGDMSQEQLLDALRGMCIWIKDEKRKQPPPSSAVEVMWLYVSLLISLGV